MAAAGLPIVAVAVLGIEVQVAARGRNLDDVELTYPKAAADDTRTAVWIGDSTAYGIGVPRAEQSVAARVAAAREESVVMLAVSGATRADVIANQLGRVERAAPDIVYISVGANDTTHVTRRPAFEAMYRRLLDGLPRGIPVVALGVPDMGAPPRLAQPLRAIAGFRGRQLDAIVRQVVADRPGTTYVDLARRTGPPFRRHPDRYFAGDGYHPSTDGYGLWAEAVLATVGR